MTNIDLPCDDDSSQPANELKSTQLQAALICATSQHVLWLSSTSIVMLAECILRSDRENISADLSSNQGTVQREQLTSMV